MRYKPDRPQDTRRLTRQCQGVVRVERGVRASLGNHLSERDDAPAFPLAAQRAYALANAARRPKGVIVERNEAGGAPIHGSVVVWLRARVAE